MRTGKGGWGLGKGDRMIGCVRGFGFGAYHSRTKHGRFPCSPYAQYIPVGSPIYMGMPRPERPPLGLQVVDLAERCLQEGS